MDYENPWIYKDKPFTSDDIQDSAGFVYVITNMTTGKAYIGKKFFIHKRSTKVKGKVRRKIKYFESDWMDYYGSSISLQEDVKSLGKHSFKREIIGTFITKGQVNYNETKYQFIYNVLEELDQNGNRKYYNENILGRYFPPKPKKA